MTLLAPFHSQRLSYRPIAAADAPALLDIYSTPAVIAGMPGVRPILSPDQATIKISDLMATYHRTGLGLMAVEVTDTTSPMIGLAGVSKPAGDLQTRFSDHLELGYVLHPLFWGKGLATEMVSAWIERCMAYSDRAGLVAAIAPHNAASQRVMHKTGFQFAGTGQHLTKQMRFYTRQRSA